jgi:hypothetical protein
MGGIAESIQVSGTFEEGTHSVEIGTALTAP